MIMQNSYHLYARRISLPGRVRLTVYPVPKKDADTMFAKLLPETQSRAFILPADPDDKIIPDSEI